MEQVYKQKHRLVGLISISASLTGNQPSKENLHTSIVKLRRRFGAIKIYLNTPSNSKVAWTVVLSKAVVLLLLVLCLPLLPMFVGLMCFVLVCIVHELQRGFLLTSGVLLTIFLLKLTI